MDLDIGRTIVVLELSFGDPSYLLTVLDRRVPALTAEGEGGLLAWDRRGNVAPSGSLAACKDYDG
jgi:hypothetical protein